MSGNIQNDAKKQDGDSSLSWFCRLRSSFTSLFGLSSAPWSLKQYQFAMLLHIFVANVFGFGVLAFRAGATDNWKTLPVSLLWACGAAALSSLLGFIFAVPRTGEPDAPKAHYAINRNLQDISDWLTKLIIGVSLVEFRDILAGFRNGAELLGRGLGGTEADTALALGLLMYFTGNGFFGGYVLTRLYLAAAFRLADEGVVERLSNRVEALERQSAEVAQQKQLEEPKPAG